MPFVEDTRLFLNEFALDAVLGAGPGTVRGIFDYGYATAGDYMAGAKTTFECATADLLADPRGQRLQIKGVVYQVNDFEPRDDAFVLLHLEAT